MFWHTPPEQTKVVEERVYIDPRENRALHLKKFLEKISQLESSGGRDLAHKEMGHSMHEGTSAVGEYGLMPLTAKDIARGSGLDEVANMETEAVQAKLAQDPELAKRLAETMASKLLNKNSEDVAAYKWLHGQYSKPSKEELANSDRVKKFKVLNAK